jgi:biopolymer transport protein ExbD
MLLNLDIKRKKNRISLTPLIDVVFILLLFFMLSSTFTKWRKVDMPLFVNDGEQSSMQQEKQHRWVLKANDGTVWFGAQQIRLSDSSSIENIVQRDPEYLFLIDAQAGVNVQSLLTLADQLKRHGAEQVSIAQVFSE